MKPSPLLLTGMLLVALGAPAPAQQPPPAPTSGTVTGPNAGHGGMAHGMIRLLFGLDGITPQQHDQLQALVAQFQQSHPAGSPRDPAAMRTLRQQVMQILTPAQQTQLQTEIQQMRAQREQQPQPGASPPPLY